MSFVKFRASKVVFFAVFLVFLFLFNSSYSLSFAQQEKTAADLKREAVELYHSGAYVQAIEKLKQIEDKTTDKFLLAQSYIYLSMSYYCLEEKEEAAKWLNKAVKTNPEINEADLLFPPGFDGLFGKAKEEAKSAQAKAAPVAKKPVVKTVAGTGEKKKKKSSLFLIVGGVAGAGILAVALMGKKTPKPTTGSIQVNSTPTGAKVYMDGSDTGKTTNCTLSEASPGSHAIRLVKDGYVDYSGSANVTAGQTETINAPLTMNTISVTLPTASTVWTKGSQVEIRWQVAGGSVGQTQAAVSSLMDQPALAQQRLLAQPLGALQIRRGATERISRGGAAESSVRAGEGGLRTGASRDLEGNMINRDTTLVQGEIQSRTGAVGASATTPSPRVASPLSVLNPLRPGQATGSSSVSTLLDIAKVKIDLYNGSTLITPPIVAETSGSAGTYLWVAPNTLASGNNYKVRISCTTDSSVFKETAAFTISEPLQPDLVVDSLTHSPASPNTLETITLTAVVRNAGTVSAGPFVAQIGCGGDTVPPTYNISSLAPGATVTLSRNLQRPNSVQISYTAEAKADINNQVVESNEGNNTKGDSFTVYLPPDLVVSSLTARVSSAGQVTLTAVVRNAGAGPAPASVLRGTVSSAIGRFTRDFSVIGLGAGISTSVELIFAAPPEPLPGVTYTIRAEADITKVVTETDESNNWREISVIGPASDRQ